MVPWVLIAASVALCPARAGEWQVIEPRFLHLRTGETPEWEDYSGTADERRIERSFEFGGDGPAVLSMRQANVKFDWRVEVNGTRVGALSQDEGDLVRWIDVPAGILRRGENRILISTGSGAEDIGLGELKITAGNRDDLLTGEVRVRVRGEVEKGSGALALIPCRLTLVDLRGVRRPLAAVGIRTAVREGVVYSAPGEVLLRLEPGEYLVYANRGPEYGVASRPVRLEAGVTSAIELELFREVATPGWVACDTHIHTLTLSGHGDATLAERVLTLAGEGVELAVAAEHNRHSDYRDAVAEAGLSKWMTPVRGNEVTTSRGHFNIFPTAEGSKPPNWRTTDWGELIREIRGTSGVEVVILNHPRDVHSGFRPFAETNLLQGLGEDLRGAGFPVDAVELINSGALRTDMYEPIRDWFGLLNAGRRIVGVGASDSHDVTRFIVGQGRTYIAADDRDPGGIDVETACANLRAGRAMVSLGLLARIEVEGGFGPGDVVRGGGLVSAEVQVSGPSWARLDTIELFANGELVERISVDEDDGLRPGLKKTVKWVQRNRGFDTYLVVIASGPGIVEPFWPVARPYQASSPRWVPRVMSITNPVWIDADANGRFDPPIEYARKLIEEHRGNPAGLLKALGAFDGAVAGQAAVLLGRMGVDFDSGSWIELLRSSPEVVQEGFAAYRRARQLALQPGRGD